MRAAFVFGIALRIRHHNPDPPNPACALLRARSERPNNRRTAERGNEFSPSDVNCHATLRWGHAHAMESMISRFDCVGRYCPSAASGKGIGLLAPVRTGLQAVSFADLSGAELIEANLSGADLHYSRNLTQTQLDLACGNAETKLPEGLTLEPCSTAAR